MDGLLEPERLGDNLDRLYRAAWALCGSRHDADDLVQETYVRVLAKPRVIRRGSELGYLLRALRNTFLSQREKQMRVVPVPDAVVAERADPSSGSRPEIAIETGELFAEIAALEPAQRDVIVAVDVAGLSYKEAARAVGAPKGTVMSRLYRARERIAARLADDAVPESTPNREVRAT